MSSCLLESFGACGFFLHTTFNSYCNESCSVASSISIDVLGGYSNNLGSAFNGKSPNLKK